MASIVTNGFALANAMKVNERATWKTWKCGQNCQFFTTNILPESYLKARLFLAEDRFQKTLQGRRKMFVSRSFPILLIEM